MEGLQDHTATNLLELDPKVSNLLSSVRGHIFHVNVRYKTGMIVPLGQNELVRLKCSVLSYPFLRWRMRLQCILVVCRL